MAATTDRATSPLQGDRLTKPMSVALCDGMFSYADGNTATRIIRECLKLCDGSEDTLSQILQTKFVANHTPFFWVIANIPEDDRRKTERTIPPLLAEFLKMCGDLPDETQNEILEALFVNSDNSLYQLTRSRLPCFGAYPPESCFRADSDQPKYRLSIPPSSGSHSPSSFTLAFNIPRFYDRIVIGEGSAYDFLANGSLWRFVTIATPSDSDCAWHFVLTETYSKNKLKPSFVFWRSIEVKIAGPGQDLLKSSGNTKTDTVTTVSTQYSKVPNSIEVYLRDHPVSKLYANPFVSQSNRALNGSILVRNTEMSEGRYELLTLSL